MDRIKQKYLEELGVDFPVNLARCLGKEEFYAHLLEKFIHGTYIEDIEKGLEQRDYEMAFRACHSLKGVSVNLGLDRLYETTIPLTEALRQPPYDVEKIKSYFEIVKKSHRENVENIKKALA